VERKRQEKRQENDANDGTEARLPKKPYATPIITEYVSVAKLTQSGFGSISDGGGFTQLKNCL
jgi:hypothetical protein